MHDHTQGCEFHVVNCSNIGCSQQIQRRNEHEHSCSCEYRLIECPNQGCSQFCAFKDMIDHLQSRCSMQLVVCPLIGVGCTPECTGYVKRLDLEAHIARPSNMMIFIQQVAEKLQKQECDIEELKNSLCAQVQAHRIESATQEARIVQLEKLVVELQRT